MLAPMRGAALPDTCQESLARGKSAFQSRVWHLPRDQSLQIAAGLFMEHPVLAE